jgi:actin-related protein
MARDHVYVNVKNQDETEEKDQDQNQVKDQDQNVKDQDQNQVKDQGQNVKDQDETEVKDQDQNQVKDQDQNQDQVKDHGAWRPWQPAWLWRPEWHVAYAKKLRASERLELLENEVKALRGDLGPGFRTTTTITHWLQNKVLGLQQKVEIQHLQQLEIQHLQKLQQKSQQEICQQLEILTSRCEILAKLLVKVLEAKQPPGGLSDAGLSDWVMMSESLIERQHH